MLSKESGIELENDLTLIFKKDILSGKWEKALEMLEMMNLPKDCYQVLKKINSLIIFFKIVDYFHDL